MANELKENLGYLGEEFQYKLTKSLIEDSKFLNSVSKMVDANLFTVIHLKQIVGLLCKYARRNPDRHIKYFELSLLVKEEFKTNEKLCNEICETLEYIGKLTVDNAELINENAIRFFKQQNLSRAIIKAFEIVKGGKSEDFTDVEALVKDALDRCTLEEDEGYKIFDGIEEALRDDYRQPIPTGYERLDNLLKGGIGKGELGVIIAPSGVGKTSTTTGFVAHAASHRCVYNDYKGFKVLHIHFEDTPVNIKRKFIGNLTQIEAQDLSNPTNKDAVINAVKNDPIAKMRNENIVAMRKQSGQYSASDLKNTLTKLKSKGFHPDLVVVDYFECLRLESAKDAGMDNDWSREGATARRLEAIANEFNVAIWCPIQGTKSSIGQEFVRTNDGGGSVKKIQVAHIVLTLSRTYEQSTKDLMNITIGKVRGVRNGGIIQNATFNNGTCLFSDNENTKEITDTGAVQQTTPMAMNNRMENTVDMSPKHNNF